jgi:hypothetical protein
MASQHLRDVVPLERLERVGVTSFFRDSNEQIVVELVDLVRVVAKVLEVTAGRVLPVEEHAAQEAPVDGCSPVPAEVDPVRFLSASRILFTSSDAPALGRSREGIDVPISAMCLPIFVS